MGESDDEGNAALQAINTTIGDCVRDTYREEEAALVSVISSLSQAQASIWQYPEPGQRESLLVSRTPEWIELILWAQIAILSGVYESALRELRYLLEDILVSVVADQENPTGSIEDKLKTVKKLEARGEKGRGGGLIKLCREKEIILDDEIKKTLKDQYHELCDFTHPSRKIVERRLDHEQDFRFSYDRKRHSHTIKIFTGTVDCLLLVLLWRMSTKAQRQFALSSETLQRAGFKKTAEVCTSIKEEWWKAMVKDLASRN